MLEQQAVQTPYVTQGPVAVARQFYGREAVFAWVEGNLAADPPRREMVLTGPPQDRSQFCIASIGIWASGQRYSTGAY